MILLNERLTGSTEFDGTTGAGLIDFSLLTLNASLGFKPSIVSLVLDTGDISLTLPQITVVLVQPGGGSSNRATIVNAADASGFAKLGCDIPVPRNSNGDPWELQVFTPGKTITAALLVEYTVGYFGGSDG